MNKVFLSKSKYKRGHQCKKILWLEKYKKDLLESTDEKAVFKMGTEVGELAKGLFGDYEDISADLTLTQKIEKTNELLLNKPNIITEASFSYDNNFCSVDILKNNLDGVEFYEVKSAANIKPTYLVDAAYQYYVLHNLGLNVKKVGLVLIDSSYIKEAEIDIKKLFRIEDITSKVKEKQEEIIKKIEEIRQFMEEHDESNEPDICICDHCFDSYLCNFWEYCRGDLPSPNIFDIVGMRNSTKFKKYFHKGKKTFKDLYSSEDFNKLTPNQRLQVKWGAEEYDKPYVDDEKIAKFLQKVKKYPLYFIDYESINPPIPEYEGTRPYQQICFQYSLHVIKEEGAPVEHKAFLADEDDENVLRTFAESLVEAIPEDEKGTVIVYNQTFECQRNKELGKLFDDLKDDLKRINDSIVDFEVPFKKKYYYAKEMQGYSSLKYVLPALYPELDYSNLKLVHNGPEASDAFLRLRHETLTEKERRDIRDRLLEYCERDTYALVKIWETLKEATNDD